MKLTIAFLQLLPAGSLEENLDQGIKACLQAKEKGADSALFPEMWSCGYSFPHEKESLRERAAPCDGFFVRRFSEMAAELDMAIAITFLERHEPKPRNWISAEAFRRQYAELIAAYRALSPAPRIVICTPPCAFKPINRFFYITNDARLDRVPEIAEAVKTVAAENGAELVDLYALTQGKRELFGPDGLHPNAAGAKRIAEAVFRTLSNTCAQGGKP